MTYYYGGAWTTIYNKNIKYYYSTVLKIFNQEVFFYIGLKFIL